MNIILNICKTELLENSLFYQCSMPEPDTILYRNSKLEINI